jgi:hypothetical protein
VTEKDPHVQWFWQALHSFTQTEKCLFLRFAWGRERLPPEEELKHEEMKIFPLAAKVCYREERKKKKQFSV